MRNEQLLPLLRENAIATYYEHYLAMSDLREILDEEENAEPVNIEKT